MSNYPLNINGVPQRMQDLAWLQNYIDRHKRGCFSAKELFTFLWSKFRRQRYYGKWFKEMVERGFIEGIRISRQRSNKSWEYELF